MHRHAFSLALLAMTAEPTFAQFTNWAANQINTEICVWYQPRAALVRDMVYLDGGDIWWMPGLNDGTLGTAVNNGNFGGIILNYNLSMPFGKDTNVTGILLTDNLSKARGGTGENSNAAAPNYYDGGMLANDAEFFLYGGAILRNDDLYDPPDADEVLGYEAYAYGPDKPLWKPGFDDARLKNDVTRYIAYGGAVNAPSENKAWYFSGLTSPGHGNIFTNSPNNTNKAVNVSDTLITLDLSQQLKEVWGNKTLPDDVKGRANPEVVWVPVGKEGILVVLGGVVYPEWAGTSHKSADEDASKKESPAFMSTIDIYDVANDTWYKQPTEDGPGASARGCAVVAAASDASSFNIYYYGGFDGISPLDAFSDVVWVLSLPSFTWTKLNEGTSLHGRAGHKCFMPYPDQMMVFGGYTPLAGTVISCLDKGPVVLFNVTSGEWMDSYDPADHGNYGVHEKIQSQIGGDASGGATVTTPVPSGWATPALGKVFETAYDTAKITTYYPYNTAANETSRPNLDNPDDGKSGGGGSSLPKWVGPVLGVLLGLMFVTGTLVLFCLWRRRKIFKNRSSDDGTEDAGKRIISWMRGQNTEKAMTVTTTEDSPRSPYMEETRALDGTTPSGTALVAPPVEMADTQLVELGDTSPPVELHDTSLSPLEIMEKHSRVGKPTRSGTTPSYSSFSLGQDHASTVSYTSGAAQSSNMPTSMPDSPTPHGRVISDVSGVSERDATHLRQLSETVSLGSVPEADRRPILMTAMSRTPDETPISPPTAEDAAGEDYLSSRSVVSPLRRSAFLESEEDMGKVK
ncbi:hypothetical protein G7046_g4238 [Stylonectria norvegica]|nr:hypothetical protein G7046_g4238 [Stylonectria norvegica]